MVGDHHLEAEMHLSVSNTRRRTGLLRPRGPSPGTRFILASLVLALLYCEKGGPTLEQTDYYSFHLAAGEAMCEKMLECYQPFLRTLRPDYQRQVDRNACITALRRDLREKLEIHTPEIQQLSRLCYTELLERDCKEFLVGTALIPTCQLLRERTSEEFQKYPELLRRLNDQE
jgi:hypothetical protein